MTGIEVFSLCAWATTQARDWNFRKGRGIIYRGYETVADSERFFAGEIRLRAKTESLENIKTNNEYRSRVE